MCAVEFIAAGGFGTRAVFPEAGEYSLVFEVTDGLEITRRQIAVTVAPAASHCWTASSAAAATALPAELS